MYIYVYVYKCDIYVCMYINMIYVCMYIYGENNQKGHPYKEKMTSRLYNS